jgi:hypothetical protein
LLSHDQAIPDIAINFLKLLGEPGCAKLDSVCLPEGGYNLSLWCHEVEKGKNLLQYIPLISAAVPTRGRVFRPDFHVLGQA